MNILRLLFGILNNIETGSLTAGQLSELGNLFAALVDGQENNVSKQQVVKVAKSLIEAPQKKRQAPQSNSRLRAGYDRQAKDWEARQRAEYKRQLKEIEQMAAAEWRQQLGEWRVMILAIKKMFAVLESNFYDRLAVYTPVDTGNLLSSLYTRHIGLFSIQIGFNTHKAPYAIYVHECDYKHPNGGIAQFLLIAFTEAWMYTRAALNELPHEGRVYEDDQTTMMSELLNNMTYTIDISKNKLAVTISLVTGHPELGNMQLADLADDLDGSDAKEIMEQQLKDYTQYVFNLSNTTKIPNAKLNSLSRPAKKKLTLFSLYKQLDENSVSSQSARKRAERLENTAKSLYKTTEIYEQAASIKLKSNEQQVVAEMLNTNTDLSLAARLSAREHMNKKIIYPLIIEQLDKEQRKAERAKAEEEKARQTLIDAGYINDDDSLDDYFDDEEDIDISDDDFAAYQSELQILQPDQPANVEGEAT